MADIDTGDLSQRELLIRLSTRQEQIREDIREIRAVFHGAATKKDLEELAKGLVTKGEFQPIKTIVYGLVAIILTTVATALISGVIR